LIGNQIPLHNSLNDNVKSFWYNFGRKMVEELPADFIMKSEIINIITELYYGNIDPQARGFKKDSYLQKQMSILSKCEAELTDKLDGEEKKAFLSFVNASNIILGESELDSFIVGFRLGARFIYDTFMDSTAPYEDFLREVNNES